MKKHYPLLLALLCTLSSGAWAQWQWVEKDGRKVFSDRAPPIDIPEQNILRRPGGHQRAVAPAVEATPGEVAAPDAPKASKVDPALQARKAQADAAEAAKKKADDERVAKSQAENCARAQAAKTTFESGQLLRHTNAKGESVFMDEATRNAEQQRIQKVIDTNCKR